VQLLTDDAFLCLELFPVPRSLLKLQSFHVLPALLQLAL